MDDTADTDGAPSGRGSDAISVLTSKSSFSSAFSSSNVDTESSTSFFQERSTTLGSLIGIDGEANLANDHDVPLDAPSNQATSMHLPQSIASSQNLSFTGKPGICGGAKLCGLLSCGACKQLWYSNSDTCRMLRSAKKGDTHVEVPTRALFSVSLGHLLVAERDAERSHEKDVDGRNNGASVYINIMYEENAGLEQVAINPLFDIQSASVRQVNNTVALEQAIEHQRRHHNSSGELGLPSFFCVEDEPHVKVTRKMSKTGRHASAAPGHQTMLPSKAEKRFSMSLCEMGCVSYMWTRCRM
ncbi:hypothetical protein L7F22_066141 [Adiantum nelumboides]|nr:hypothetical protein [Adiantum nelumboides]MCO5611882.1 hypothetical protein [Adiantum nelumboides]